MATAPSLTRNEYTTTDSSRDRSAESILRMIPMHCPIQQPGVIQESKIASSLVFSIGGLSEVAIKTLG
jgi:hypothetical protein